MPSSRPLSNKVGVPNASFILPSSPGLRSLSILPEEERESNSPAESKRYNQKEHTRLSSSAEWIVSFFDNTIENVKGITDLFKTWKDEGRKKKIEQSWEIFILAPLPSGEYALVRFGSEAQELTSRSLSRPMDKCAADWACKYYQFLFFPSNYFLIQTVS